MAFFTPPTRSKQPTLKRGSIGVKKRPVNKTRPFSVTIKVDGHHIFIGEYRTERDAAEAYDQASLVIHGDQAVLNFPDKKYNLDQMSDFIERKVRQKKNEKGDNATDTL